MLYCVLFSEPMLAITMTALTPLFLPNFMTTPNEPWKEHVSHGLPCGRIHHALSQTIISTRAGTVSVFSPLM